MRFARICSALLACATLEGAYAQQPRSLVDDPAIEHRVDELLARMTLDEKVGQLVHYSAGIATGPGTPRADYLEQIAGGRVGSFENLVGAAKVNAFQRISVEKSRLHIPLLFALDVIHGYRTIFPVPLAMASTWDPALVEKASRAAAREATAEGIRQTYSPMVDIARDARWGRIVEGAGEDPYLGSLMAAAYVRGYQGASLDDPQSMVACLKHFVGYGAAEAGRDYNTVDMSDRRLRQVYLPPFHAGVEAGAGTIMSAFNSLNGVPASANFYTLTTILRQEWGYRGFVMSDWGSIGEMGDHGIATDGVTLTRKAILAGVDIDHESSLYTRYLAGLVRSGEVPESVVDESVRRVLRVKFALGLFERPYTSEPPSGAAQAPDPANVELARTVAERSFVLLKNDPVHGEALLPLQSGTRVVALIGPLADSAPDMLGPWVAEGSPRDVVTLRMALESRMARAGGQLLYAEGAKIDGSEPGFPDAVETARKADVVILALGENSQWMSGEAASRAYLNLPGRQQQLLEAVEATGKPVVLVVFSGRPLDLSWTADHVPAILQAWFPGVQAGPAIERVLFGDANPSGKLTVSMPRTVGQEPLYYDHLNTGRPADGVDLDRPPSSTGEKYHSRYIDARNDPLFAFGHGLSYTRFTYAPLALSASEVSASAMNGGGAPSLRVSTTVTNAGSREGDEIAELYVRLRGTSISLPVRQLEGFRRISLKPGESARVEFSIGRDQLAFWNIDMRDVVEPAQATVWVGPSSTGGESADFTIAK